VVGIESDFVALDTDNGDDLVALVILGFKLHTGLYLIAVVELAKRHRLDPILIPFPVALIGGHVNGEFVSLFASFEGIFETGNELTIAMDVGQGAIVFGSVN